MASNRKELYKNPSATTKFIKDCMKTSIQESRTKSRENVLLRKRLKVGFRLEFETEDGIRPEEDENRLVIDAIKSLKKGEKLKALTTLHGLFASHQSNADVFMKNDGLQPLHSCFKSTNVEIIHTSAWCFINLAAAASPCYSSALLGLTSTLLQFLKGSDMHMQELCAWGVANLAGEGQTTATVLHAQGCTDILMDRLNTIDYLSNEEMTRCLLFALINLARSNALCAQYMQEKEIHNLFESLVKIIPVDSALNFEIGWLAYCVFTGYEKTFQPYSIHVTDLISNRLNKLVVQSDILHIEKVCFPLIRCLCNVTSSSPFLSRVILDNVNSFHTIARCLEIGSNGLKQAVFILLNHSMADIISRVLLTFSPLVSSQVLIHCSSHETALIIKALELVHLMTKTSSYADSYLLDQGLVNILLQTLTNVIHSTVLDLTEDHVIILKLTISSLIVVIRSQPDLSKHYLEMQVPQTIAVIVKFLSNIVKTPTTDKDLLCLVEQFQHLSGFA